MIKLLGRQTSGNVQKVLFLLEEIGVPYERQDYGRQFGNTQTDEYKALNPNSKVPTLVDGETVIWESNTILRYLAATYSPLLSGGTPAEKTEVERWMDWVLAAVNAPYLAIFKDSKKPAEERAPDYKAQSDEMAAQLKILDGHLAKNEWLALGRFTIADAALGPIIARCMDFPIDRPAFANIDRWRAALATRPAFKTATGAKG